MDESTPKKSTSFETLVIQNISNVNDLKSKLNEIIESGKNYEYDVSSCLKTLIQSDDQSIVLLTVQAISEIVKCEVKRETYALAEIIEPILLILKRDITVDNSELMKQCLRALGNLCCDCDTSRNIMLEKNGITILRDVLKATLDNSKLSEIKLLTCKTLLNFAIGGKKFSEHLIKEYVIELLRKILTIECYKECMDEDEVTTALLLLSVTNDNDPEVLYDEDVNKAVLKVLEEATSVEVSELCLELLHSQAENDSVKTLLAKENGVQLVCVRLEQLIERLNSGYLNADVTEIEAVMKQACDLIIIVLTGDEAMDILYKKGTGEVYQTMVRWLDSSNHNLLTTGTLAIGNFARQDDYCVQMMETKIFDKLLNIFETYHNYGVSAQEGGAGVDGPGADVDGSGAGVNGQGAGVDGPAAERVQHAALAALRNLSVPARNKRPAARAAPALLAALPPARDPRLADQLLAALRLLLDEESALALSASPACLRALGAWGRSAHARASAEACRLLARAARLLPPAARARLAQAEGCVASLVSMMVAPHSLMQSEAILALTLLAAAEGSEGNAAEGSGGSAAEGSGGSAAEGSGGSAAEGSGGSAGEGSGGSAGEGSVGGASEGSAGGVWARLRDADVARHAALLLDSNCGKMPAPVADNLLALLQLSAPALAPALRRADVARALRNFADARDDLSAEFKARVDRLVAVISDADSD